MTKLGYAVCLFCLTISGLYLGFWLLGAAWGVNAWWTGPTLLIGIGVTAISIYCFIDCMFSVISFIGRNTPFD